MKYVPSSLNRRILQNKLEKLGIATGLIPSHSDYRKFIILGRGRSGSNFLATSLSSHPQVVNFGELFNNNARNAGSINFQYPGYHGKDARLVSQRDNRPVEFLDQSIFGSYPKKIQAVGFKLFYYHAQEPEWQPVWEYLREQNIQVLHIQRRNNLEALVSQRLAEVTRNWFHKGQPSENSSEEPHRPIELSIADCEHHFNEIDNQRQTYGSYFESTLDVAYEDIVGNYGLELERVQNFLGLTPTKLTTELRKQEKRKMSEVISNFEELRETFAGTKWAPFFDVD